MDLETVLDDTPGTQEPCHVCGEANFFCEGGFYYCFQCNTQSQSARLYVDEDFVPGRLTQTRAAVLRKGSKKKATEPKAKYILSTWEVWNIVLKHMADRLIEIGFPEIVRTKIFTLYVTFMLRRKVIFVSKTNEQAKSRITFGEPKMNLYSLYGIKPPKRRKIVRRRNITRQKSGSKVARADTIKQDEEGQEGGYLRSKQLKAKKTITKRKAMEQEYLKKAIELAETNAAFDVVVSKPQQEKPEAKPRAPKLTLTKASTKLKSLVLKRALITVRKRRETQKTAAKRETISAGEILDFERFSLTTTLILVFVALRQLGFPIVFSDIMRLYFVGILRVDKIHSLIGDVETDEDISKVYDTILFNTKLQSPLACAQRIDNFIKYVGVKKFQYPKMKELIPKYLDEFVLPRELECFVNILNQMFSLEDYIFDMRSQLERFQTVPEVIVLVQMIVVLKMLFGLDDRTEKFQSTFAKTVNKIMKEEVDKRKWEMEDWTELFVIEEWFGYLRRRRDLVKRELFCSFMYTPNNPPTITKLRQLIQEKSNANSENDSVSAVEAEAIKACTTIFADLFKKLTLDAGLSEIPVVKPYITLPLPSQSVVDQYLQRYPAVVDPGFKPELFKQDFFKKRIDFIWNPKKYVKLLKMRGYSVKIIHGDAINNCPLQLDEGEEMANVIPLFQPYKEFDEFIGSVRDQCSSSMKLLLGLCEDIVTGESGEKIKVSKESTFQTLVNKVGDMYIKRCISGLVPVLTKMNESDSDSESD